MTLFLIMMDILEWLAGQIPGITHGIFVGISAVLIYIGRKRWEYCTNKSSYASILYEEMRRNFDRYAQETPIAIQILKKASSSNGVYYGLLSSGNIKYFDGPTQNDLDDMYAQFSNPPELMPDLKQYKRIILTLEKMNCKWYSFIKPK